MVVVADDLVTCALHSEYLLREGLRMDEIPVVMMP